MGIGLGRIGNIKVDHMGYTLHVDPSGRDIRGDQNVKLLLSETLHGPVPLGLGHISLKSDGSVTRSAELLGESARSMFRAREDNRRVTAVFGQELFEEVSLAIFPDGNESVLDGFGRPGLSQLNHLGVLQQPIGQRANFLGHGGREEQVLSILGKTLENSSKIRQEAHIKHVVGFIKDQDFDGIQAKDALSHEVKNSSRASDHDLGPFAKRLGLAVRGYAAVDRDDLLTGKPGQGADFSVDLGGEFPGGRQDESPRPSARFSFKVIEHGQRESRGFAGAGLGQAQDVLPFEGRMQGLGLNGSRCFEAGGFDAALNVGVKVELGEAL